jgi:hypothetical protein
MPAVQAFAVFHLGDNEAGMINRDHCLTFDAWIHTCLRVFVSNPVLANKQLVFEACNLGPDFTRHRVDIEAKVFRKAGMIFA